MATATTTPTVPAHINDMFARNERIVRVVEYTDGWVPNAYRWRAPGRARVYERSEDGIRVTVSEYDRKRSYGRGPWLVGFSARGGRLASRY